MWECKLSRFAPLKKPNDRWGWNFRRLFQGGETGQLWVERETDGLCGVSGKCSGGKTAANLSLFVFPGPVCHLEEIRPLYACGFSC